MSLGWKDHKLNIQTCVVSLAICTWESLLKACARHLIVTQIEPYRQQTETPHLAIYLKHHRQVNKMKVVSKPTNNNVVFTRKAYIWEEPTSLHTYIPPSPCMYVFMHFQAHRCATHSSVEVSKKTSTFVQQLSVQRCTSIVQLKRGIANTSFCYSVEEKNVFIMRKQNVVIYI